MTYRASLSSSASDFVIGRRRAAFAWHQASSRYKTFFLVTLTAVAAGAGLAYEPRLTSEISLGLFAAGVCMLLPPRALPIIAVVVSVIVPVQIYKAPIGIIPFGVWLLRSPRLQASTLTRCLAIGLAFWLILSELAAPFHIKTGLTWLITMMIAVIAPVVFQKGRSFALLRKVYVDMATILAAYGVLEKFVLHSSPIYGSFYTNDSIDPVRQIWSTYRATTLIGQPLINAVIFGSAFVLSVDAYLSRSRRGWLPAARCIALVAGLAATVSRGPTVAALVGVLVLLLARRGAGISVSRRSLIAIIIVAATLVAVPMLEARNESSQGRGSVALRSHLVAETERAAGGHFILGVGPGQAEASRERSGLRHHSLPLESMFAEVLVEVGIPGVILLYGLILSVVLTGLRRQATVGSAAALLTMLIALSTYASIEARQGLMVILGLLITFTLTRAPDEYMNIITDGRKRPIGQRSTAPVAHETRQA